MKTFIHKLRKWCGTEDVDNEREILNNKGRVYVWLSVGAVIAIIFFGTIFLLKCSDKCTCGLSTKCLDCTCGVCDACERACN